jgi:hypothetical protein
MQGRFPGRREFQWVCGSLLIGATIALSGRYACATPFAALAALIALASDRKSGFILIGTIWLANQAVGFAFLNYPIEFQSIAWGFMLGISAVLSLLAARFAIAVLGGSSSIVAACMAFVFAFCTYEESLYAATLISSSGGATFAWPVIAAIAAINTAAFAVLACAYHALLAAGLLRQSLLPARSVDFRGAKPQTA